jgi:hypothetical protein
MMKQRLETLREYLRLMILAVVCLFLLLLLFQKPLINFWRSIGSTPPQVELATTTIVQGQSWTVIRTDTNNFTCVWKKGSSVPDCLGLKAMQYQGAAGFLFVRANDVREKVFIFLYQPTAPGRPPEAAVWASDKNSDFRVDK